MSSKRSDYPQPAPRRPIDIPATPARGPSDSHEAKEPSATGAKLIVGRRIQLRGEIVACDVLVVEGEVEASMASRVIDITEGGVFKGTAEVESAEIRGCFDGNLTASRVLRVYATGKVMGRVRYGALEVATGGELAGDIGVCGQPEAERKPIKVDSERKSAPPDQAQTAAEVATEQVASSRLGDAVGRAGVGRAKA